MKLMKYKEFMKTVVLCLYIQSICMYRYNLSKYSGGSFSDYDSSGVSLSMGYNGAGTGAMVTRQGVLFPQGQILSAGGSKMNYEPGAQKIACFTLYAFTTAQYSTLFATFSTTSMRFYISLMLNNGYLRIESNYWDGSNLNVLPTVQSSSSAMFKIGWNLVCYADNGSNFFLYGFPNFATPAVSYSATNTGYTSESYFSSTFAGEFSSGSVINSFQGIIHTINIKSSYYSSTQTASNFLQINY